jgi:hypothetical protein
VDNQVYLVIDKNEEGIRPFAIFTAHKHVEQFLEKRIDKNQFEIIPIVPNQFGAVVEKLRYVADVRDDGVVTRLDLHDGFINQADGIAPYNMGQHVDHIIVRNIWADDAADAVAIARRTWDKAQSLAGPEPGEGGE